MTEPVVTYLADGTPYAVFCGRCNGGAWLLSTFGGGPGALDAAKDAARVCCTPPACGRCGEPMPNRSWCVPCHDKAALERDARDFAKAKKVPIGEYTGEMATDGEETFFAPGDFEPEEQSPIVLADGTAFFWGTIAETPSVDLERECSEDWLQEHHEDAFDQVDMAKLRAAQKLVDDALAGVKTYYEDRSVAVIVPPAEEGNGEDEKDAPYVCPGCHAVAAPCAPGCVDAAIERRRVEGDS